MSTNVTVTANNSTDETTFLAFVDGATGSQGIETDTGLTYNPNTGTLVSEIISSNTIRLGSSGDNTIKNSAGNTSITLPNASTEVQLAGNLKLGGNTIKASDGTPAITTSGANVSIAGNLNVSGNTTTINTNNLTVKDRLIKLGEGDIAEPSNKDMGIIFTRGGGGASNVANRGIIWNETNDNFIFAETNNEDGTTNGVVVVNGYSDVQMNSIIIGNNTNSTTFKSG